MRKIFLFLILSVFVSSCSSSIEEPIYKCEDVPTSNVWGKWKEVAFQKYLKYGVSFEDKWNVPNDQDQTWDVLIIKSCKDVTPEQWKKGAGCCGFLYYTLKGNKLIAEAYGGGKECANIDCVNFYTNPIIEKLEGDSLTLVHGLGKSKYLKIK